MYDTFYLNNYVSVCNIYIKALSTMGIPKISYSSIFFLKKLHSSGGKTRQWYKSKNIYAPLEDVWSWSRRRRYLKAYAKI